MVKNFTKKTIKFFILAIFCFSFIALFTIKTQIIFAKEEIETMYFTPQIEIPFSSISGKTSVGSVDKDGFVVSDLLAKYIKAIYDYGIMVGGILAALMLMAGGLIWLTSGGDSGKVSKAKDIIAGSITGVVILMGAYFILNTINPDLIAMKGVKMIVPQDIQINNICCETNGIAQMKAEETCTGTKFPGYQINDTTNKCTKFGCCYMDSGKGTGPGMCVETDETRCTEIKSHGSYSRAVFQDAVSCSDVPVCSNNNVHTMSCDGVEDSKNCKDHSVFEASCYTGKCYINPSQHYEPCGDEGGICLTAEECTSGSRDRLGGNDCDKNLKCCTRTGIF